MARRLLGLLATLAVASTSEDFGMSYGQRLALRDAVVEMHGHAHRAYMAHAFPHDELMPLSCQGRRWDKRRARSRRARRLPHGAFWPSLLLMAGDVGAARDTFEAYWSVWRKYKSLPELFDLSKNDVLTFARTRRCGRSSRSRRCIYI
ncbi:mannosyl-oligosaccharide 1,2-alpha-mannosidase [Aureococcus anophagefferens]|nr:mannosyl-oligosaccharide 1,2-alpha-mannosidase [Aureococcus anophagefferens]